MALRVSKVNNKINIIKVTFEDETTKSNSLKSKKYLRDNQIFLNQKLPKTYLDLFMTARGFKKDCKVLCIGNGNIFLRKNER